jgi:hypothetical protein
MPDENGSVLTDVVQKIHYPFCQSTDGLQTYPP